MPETDFNPDKYTIHELLRSVQFNTMKFEEAEEFLIKKLAHQYLKGFEDGQNGTLDTSQVP